MVPEPLTKTFDLSRGYVDTDGHAHRRVTVRTPLADDEIKAHAMVRQHQTSGGGAFFEGTSDYALNLCLMSRVITQLGQITGPLDLVVLRKLTRVDVQKIERAILELERQEEELLLDKDKAEPDPGEALGNASSGSADASPASAPATARRSSSPS